MGCALQFSLRSALRIRPPAGSNEPEASLQWNGSYLQTKSSWEFLSKADLFYNLYGYLFTRANMRCPRGAASSADVAALARLLVPKAILVQLGCSRRFVEQIYS